ncbi:hypothetical protein AVEN_158788-1 [Araneus ventricosus]|uniref:Uncharacterized protein n=1 Tax=Araneus ventricosus TaxID=182803 RepID=A0A4Y2V6L1_ARAVE|nr:hypothetical protein AVEN_158788-1 [Araneus ventricosus]
MTSSVVGFVVLRREKNDMPRPVVMSALLFSLQREKKMICAVMAVAYIKIGEKEIFGLSVSALFSSPRGKDDIYVTRQVVDLLSIREGERMICSWRRDALLLSEREKDDTWPVSSRLCCLSEREKDDMCGRQ